MSHVMVSLPRSCRCVVSTILKCTCSYPLAILSSVSYSLSIKIVSGLFYIMHCS